VSQNLTEGSVDSSNSSAFPVVSPRFEGSDEEFNRLFEWVMREFQGPLESYLQQRQVPRERCEEAVQDFFAKQYVKRTVFPRLQRWLTTDQTPERCLTFLKACVLHHYFDLHRKSERQQSVWQALATDRGSEAGRRAPKDWLNVNWAAHILQVAMQDLQAALLADDSPVDLKIDGPGERSYSNGLLNWRIFVERFGSPSVRRLVHGHKSTANEIGNRLGLSREQVAYRIQCLRDQFERTVRQALVDSSLEGHVDQMLGELREALIVGGIHLPDLLRELPATDADSSIDAANIFSMVAVEHHPADEAIELLVPTDPGADSRQTQELWFLVLRRPFRPAAQDPGTTESAEHRYQTIEEAIFSPQPNLEDLQAIKRMARNQGQRDHEVLQQIYHLLYTVAIARAYNICGEIITSLPTQQRIHSLGHAAQYPWVPEPVARELELAIRGFADEKSKRQVD
jgi:hypothetical protein